MNNIISSTPLIRYLEMKLSLFQFTVQHECIPQAVLGMDVLCQAKSGMGKTAVFVLATLQQLECVENQVSVLVLCHTRELAFQISKEYERFSKYMTAIKVMCTELIFSWLLKSNKKLKLRLVSSLVVSTFKKTRQLWKRTAPTLLLELQVVFWR